MVRHIFPLLHASREVAVNYKIDLSRVTLRVYSTLGKKGKGYLTSSKASNISILGW